MESAHDIHFQLFFVHELYQLFIDTRMIRLNVEMVVYPSRPSRCTCSKARILASQCEESVGLEMELEVACERSNNPRVEQLLYLRYNGDDYAIL